MWWDVLCGQVIDMRTARKMRTHTRTRRSEQPSFFPYICIWQSSPMFHGPAEDTKSHHRITKWTNSEPTMYSTELMTYLQFFLLRFSRGPTMRACSDSICCEPNQTKKNNRFDCHANFYRFILIIGIDAKETQSLPGNCGVRIEANGVSIWVGGIFRDWLGFVIWCDGDGAICSTSTAKLKVVTHTRHRIAWEPSVRTRVHADKTHMNTHTHTRSCARAHTQTHVHRRRAYIC